MVGDDVLVRGDHGLPAPSAAATIVRAGSSPPMSSTTTSTSSEAARCAAGASVSSASGIPAASARSTDRTATAVSTSGAPSDGARRGDRSRRARMTSRPTVPAPITPTRRGWMLMRWAGSGGLRCPPGMVAPRRGLPGRRPGVATITAAAIKRHHSLPGSPRGKSGGDGSGDVSRHARAGPGPCCFATLRPDDRRPRPRSCPRRGPAPRPRIFSGIQPSGIVHLGNDLGAIRNYVMLAVRVRGDLLHRRLPRAHEHPRRAGAADPDPRARRRAARPGPRPRALHAVRAEPPPRAHRARVAAGDGHAGELARADADLQGQDRAPSPTT